MNEKKNEEVKIAYIVLSHKNMSQVNRLIKALKTDTTDFFVHIDKKAKTIRDELIVDKQVVLLSEDESVNVEWGHISQVYAILALIKKVYQQEKTYDYLWLISGQDFPIKTNKEIVSCLKEGGCYINISDKFWNKRNDLYYPKWIIKRGQIWRLLRRVYVEMTGGYSKTYRIFKRKPLCEKALFGSTWWALPYKCVSEIVEIVEQNPNILKYYSNSLCPDESFFQTVFSMTTYRGQEKGMLTYVDWSDGGNSPRILTEVDFEKMINSHYLLARKFDSDICDSIIDELEIHIGEKQAKG